jgi:hypothetical protein
MAVACWSVLVTILNTEQLGCRQALLDRSGPSLSSTDDTRLSLVPRSVSHSRRFSISLGVRKNNLYDHFIQNNSTTTSINSNDYMYTFKQNSLTWKTNTGTRVRALGNVFLLRVGCTKHHWSGSSSEWRIVAITSSHAPREER